ncbi:MAG: toll/interleukin-1 receptor domain-containing protein, partial [Thiohalocapsa sp.]
YADALESYGFDVWVDYKRLKPGQDWNFEIRRELNKAAIIVVFISNNSVDRRGYAQREIKLALDKAEEKLAGDIYIIPVLLDGDTPIPDPIKHLQCVKASEADHLPAIRDAIHHQLNAVGSEIKAAQDRANLSWSETKYKESWDGLPGYQAEFNLMQFSSAECPNIGDITTYLRGQLLELIMNERKVKFSQETGRFTFGQTKFSRTHTFDAHCSEPMIVGNVISIGYTVHVNYLGAHPNMFFKTYAFLLDPVFLIASLKELFPYERQEEAFRVIQFMVREQLRAHLINTEEEEGFVLDAMTRVQKTGAISHPLFLERTKSKFAFPLMKWPRMHSGHNFLASSMKKSFT